MELDHHHQESPIEMTFTEQEKLDLWQKCWTEFGTENDYEYIETLDYNPEHAYLGREDEE